MQPKAGAAPALLLLSGAILAAGLALAVPACGGNPARDALAAYESSVERVMGEDDRIQAQLGELREDLKIQNAGADALGPFARETAAPFYERFRKTVAEIPAPTKELQEIHALLMAYAGHRVAYLEALATVERTAGTGDLQRFNATMLAWRDAREALQQLAASKMPGKEVVDAIGRGQIFMQSTFEPFTRGQVGRDEAARILRTDLLPPLANLAEKTAADRAAEGEEGTVARWVKAELDFFQALAAALPDYAELMGAGRRSEEEWDLGEETRAEYLKRLKAYRESLR